MHKSLIGKAFGALLATALGVVGVQSQTIIFDSLSNTPYSGTGLLHASPIAASFSTTSSAFDLVDVKVLLNDAGSIGSGTTTVSLFSDIPGVGGAGPTPGSLLTTIGTLPDTSLTTANSVFDFTLGTPFVLSASSRYWIELSSTASSTAHWAYTSSSAGTGVASEYFYSSGSGGTFANNPTGPFYMQVSAVPEPSTLALLGLSALVGCVVVRRKTVLN